MQPAMVQTTLKVDPSGNTMFWLEQLKFKRRWMYFVVVP